MSNKRFDIKAKGVIFSLSLLLILSTGWIMFSFFSDNQREQQDLSYQRYFNERYSIFALNVPANLTFAGEAVPMDLQDIHERMDRELLVNTYWHSQSLLNLKRANRWFPVIEPILEKNGIPEDFKYLAVIESGLDNVVSPAGATGFWQLLEVTAKQYGLEVNDEVDERYHVEKSTQAACEYLKKAYAKFGSWTLAAASYNMGITGIQRQMDRQQESNYYDLLLNSETERYVFRILAAKEIIQNPAQYGFHFRPGDLYPPYETVEVKVSTPVENFATFAREHRINYKILKILNPWLRDAFLTNSLLKEYSIKLPAENSALLRRHIPLHPDHLLTDTISAAPYITDTLK